MNAVRFAIIVIVIFLVGVVTVFAYSPNSTHPVHQYITNESKEIWSLIPYEIKSHISNSLETNINDVSPISYLGGAIQEGDFDVGDDDVIDGSGEEDVPFLKTRNHLWDSDSVENGRYEDGVYNFESSYRKAMKIWEMRVIPHYLKGELDKSYYWLGRVAHLLEDATVPAHSHNDDHNSHFSEANQDSFEEYAAKVFRNYRGSNYAGDFYYYEDLPNMDASKWAQVDATDKNNIELFRLFWFTSQRAQYFASDDRAGNSNYSLVNGTTNVTFSPSLWSGETVNLTANNSGDVATHLDDISNAEIPHAMRAVAGLYRLFWDAVHVDWPTDHHDYRRTGFTLLKGDMQSSGDVDRIQIALKGNVEQETVVRPSISDIDGNGKQDVISIFHNLSNSQGSELYAVEKRDFLGRYRQKWVKVLAPASTGGGAILLPPSLGSIDSNSDKEIVVGMRNGTLFALNPEDGGERWRYELVNKHTDFGGVDGVELGGGSAIANIDLDGKNEVVFADIALGPSWYDWPGEVYVLEDNGNSATLEDKAEFNNGGAFGSVSVANIDNDDEMEIVVPSFYGISVWDFDSTNGLSLKWNNTDGLIDASVVISDVDKDNDYEIVYATNTFRCSGFKTCANKLYVRNASTGTLETEVSLTVVSRTTPAVANLDSDSNLEIVITAQNTGSSDPATLGKVIAYDSGSGAEEWSYDDGGTLKVSFVSPDIFDIDTDGNYNILFGENNGTEAYLLNNDGTLLFKYDFESFIDSALAVADIDGDGKAEIALKKAGSPVSLLSVTTGGNNPPEIGAVDNITAVAGDLIDLNATGTVLASDPENNSLSFTFSPPFNSSGLWQSTVNDTGNYSILVEVSDGNLTDFTFVDVLVFESSVSQQTNFTTNLSYNTFNFTESGNQSVNVHLPKDAMIRYASVKLGGMSQ